MPSKTTTARKRHRIVRCNGQRIAWTNTSVIPDERIVEALRFAADHADCDGVVFHFKGYHGGSNYGRCYYGIPWEANLAGLKPREWRQLVIVRDHDGWIDTLGHELKHVEQYRTGTLWRTKRERQCESQARAFGAWFARKWETASACGG